MFVAWRLTVQSAWTIVCGSESSAGRLCLNAHCSSGKQKAQGQVSRAKWLLQRVVISAAISEDLALHAGDTHALLRV